MNLIKWILAIGIAAIAYPIMFALFVWIMYIVLFIAIATYIKELMD